jgi:hypothetical protein
VGRLALNARTWQELHVPTQLSASSKVTELAGPARPAGVRPPVLARLPWVGVEDSADASSTSTPTHQLPPQTHFEYMMGDFGSNGAEGCATEYVRPPISLQSPVERAERPSMPSLAPIRASGTRTDEPGRRPMDFPEMILRLDSAIEPYTRAIVLVVIMAVATFASLLLFSPKEPPHHPAPTILESQAAAPAPEKQPPPADSTDESATREETKTTVNRTAPFAQGPPSLAVAAPPVATLSNEIQPAPVESGEYPFIDLPTPETPPGEPSEAAPLEARKHDRLPTQSYK